MARFILSSHDGFGLGHVRRNVLIAGAILRRDPSAEVVIVTGVAVKPRWLNDPRLSVVSVPPLLKADDGCYRNDRLSFADAVAARSKRFVEIVDDVHPDVIVVDRHPYGTAGELRDGLTLARDRGTSLVLGLRDIIDEPSVVAAEFSGPGWRDAGSFFDRVLVYGERWLCDHVAEYGLPVEPQYCGWVVGKVAPAPFDPRLIAVAAGGGADGARVLKLGLGLAKAAPRFRASVVAGPYAKERVDVDSSIADRVAFVTPPNGCAELYASAGVVVQMAGYNSTIEALAAGVRPILVPRRSPRREQAIRATRLAAVGLADVVDDDADPAEVAWLLERPRRFPASTLLDAGIAIDGADRAAEAIVRLVPAGVA